MQSGQSVHYTAETRC